MNCGQRNHNATGFEFKFLNNNKFIASLDCEGYYSRFSQAT